MNTDQQDSITTGEWGNILEQRGAMRIVFGAPHPTRYPHITLRTVSVNGRSTWGSRLECSRCGEVSEQLVGSSVSYEDGPGHFSRHECTPLNNDVLADDFESLDPATRARVQELRAGAKLPTYREALKLASDEYGYKRGNYSPYICCSRGADGGMHYRADAPSKAAAQAWVAEKSEDYARRIAAGEVTGTLLFWGGSGWYLG